MPKSQRAAAFGRHLTKPQNPVSREFELPTHKIRGPFVHKARLWKEMYNG